VRRRTSTRRTASCRVRAAPAVAEVHEVGMIDRQPCRPSGGVVDDGDDSQVGEERDRPRRSHSERNVGERGGAGRVACHIPQHRRRRDHLSAVELPHFVRASTTAGDNPGRDPRPRPEPSRTRMRLHVRLRRALADTEPTGGVPVRQPLGDQRNGRGDARACSLQWTATSPEEVRPMNAVSMWVLPVPVTVGRLT
jgi:hypothetical protein